MVGPLSRLVATLGRAGEGKAHPFGQVKEHEESQCESLCFLKLLADNIGGRDKGERVKAFAGHSESSIASLRWWSFNMAAWQNLRTS